MSCLSDTGSGRYVCSKHSILPDRQENLRHRRDQTDRADHDGTVSEIYSCIGCNACTKACTQNLNVMQYIAYAQRGEFEKCAEESFDCVSCGCCSVRCPAGISHPMVGLLARRLTGKYIAPEAKHLTERVEEIHKGAYDELIEQIMQKPMTEMQELYNNREIEK